MIGEPAAIVEPRLGAGEPYRADTVIDGGVACGLTVRAASVRGLSKRWAGSPRQDDICLSCHTGSRTLVAALADGVSGAANSQLGAALAVRHAVAAVCRQLDRGGEIDWHEVFDHAAWALVEAHRTASGDPLAGPEEAAALLATTLIVAVVDGASEQGAEPGAGGAESAAGGSEPAAGGSESAAGGAEPVAGGAEPAAGGAEASASVSVQLAAVGDSCAMILSGKHYEPVLGAQSPEVLLGGPVNALPRAAREVANTRTTLAPGAVLLLASDGFALPLADGENDVGEVFARELSRPPEIVDFARLLDFSRSTY